MLRHEELEKILAARYDLDYCSKESKSVFEKTLFNMVDEIIKGKNISRFELLHAIHDRYLAYKKERRKKEKVSIAQRLQA